jgi:hypothetical protein
VGSGYGKVVLHAKLSAKVREAVGIEYVASRALMAGLCVEYSLPRHLPHFKPSFKPCFTPSFTNPRLLSCITHFVRTIIEPQGASHGEH